MNGMGLSRRRLLAIAGALALPGRAAARHRWAGVAFGADVTITLDAPAAEAEPAIAEARTLVARLEAEFSLFDEKSALSRLNRSGELRDASPDFRALMAAADLAHRATGGVFDPSIQPLWRLLAQTRGRPDARARAAAEAAIGWARVGQDARITLEPGMALTFNGIAQGYATDRVTDLLAARGFSRLLVNIGEFRAGDGVWRLGFADPEFGLVEDFAISRVAVATSSPGALRFGTSGVGHILHPAAQPCWSSVSVEAAHAAVADALSTAFCLMPEAAIRAAAGLVPGITRVRLVNAAGAFQVIDVG